MIDANTIAPAVTSQHVRVLRLIILIFVRLADPQVGRKLSARLKNRARR